jgi:cystathionine gamma-synthase
MSAAVELARPCRVPVGDLPLEHGGTVPDVHVACELHGPHHAPPILVLGGISSGRNLLGSDGTRPAGWWPGVAGPGCALDPARHRLISVDYVGGRGDSSRPGAAAMWPPFSTVDQAAAIVRLLDHLHIRTLHAVVGASYGGMVALALAERHPGRVERVITIGAAHRSHPLATAIRSVQRRIVRAGLDRHDAGRAVGIARALAMTTYRSAAEFADRFNGPAQVACDGVAFPVDAYLDHHAGRYTRDFPAPAFLTLSQSLDLHRVDPGRIQARCTIVSIDSDMLVPPADSRALADALGDRADFISIRSPYGHDAFLKEPAVVGAAITAALEDRARAPARRLRTRTVRAGIGSDTQHGAVMPPIHLSTTFSFEDFGVKRAYDYTRSGNPTRDVLASAIAELEGGAAGIITPTGMAAITVVLQLLGPDDLVLAPHDGYGGTYRLLRALAERRTLDVEFADLTAPAAVELIAQRRPRLVWVETPSNPLLRITDIEAVAAAAHGVGALCVVDNTFLSPAQQTPLYLGADIVVHSTTKYLNGHSDVVGGAIVARDASLGDDLLWWANCIGATGSPFDSYLTLRGLRTLHARIRAHEENARAVVDLLQEHPHVEAVHYPGLPTHPGHGVAVRQQRGFGAMVSFQLCGGRTAARRFVDGLSSFTLAESLGGVESLIAHPATMTHAAMDAAGRVTAGISDGLLRLSVGIEAVEDLLDDLARACDRATIT